MKPEFSNFAARLHGFILNSQFAIRDSQFSELALELFGLQFKHNAAYQKICKTRRLTPEVVGHWTRIPVVPAASFKELELTCLAPDERTAVFHSSGTTKQRPSRHFHNAESLMVYEVSLWSWFEKNIFANSKFEIRNLKLVILTPPLEQAPHSSLVHMFDVIRRKFGSLKSAFVGQVANDGSWALDFEAALVALLLPASNPAPRALLLLGTAFSFVHLLDFLGERDLSFQLPLGSRVMETGGYKNRSRMMPRSELHALITEQLGIPQSHIVCEYGMSELSSQAYDGAIGRAGCPQPAGWRRGEDTAPYLRRNFHFPPWARAQIISPETSREVADGETGLIRVFDLANVFSVMAIQTEDLGVRHGDGFELLGRAQFAEPRGCSLMSIESK